MPQDIQRKALGRHAKIGSLYDVRTERILPATIFLSRFDVPQAIRNTPNPNCKTFDVIESDEIFEKIAVDSELQLSVLTGLVQTNGSGKCLEEEQKNLRSRTINLMYKIATVDESIDIHKHKDEVDDKVIQNKRCVDATHVVVGIDWGAICILKCEYENVELDQESDIQLELHEKINEIKEWLKSECPDSADDSFRRENRQTLSYTCYSDLTPHHKGMHLKFKGTLNNALFKMIRDCLVEATKEGKGVQLVYTLAPLNVVAAACNAKMPIRKHYIPIEKDLVQSCIAIASKIRKTHQALVAILDDLTEFASYVKEESIKQIKDVQLSFNNDASAYKEKLQELVKEVRSEKQDHSVLKTFLFQDLATTIDLKGYTDQIRGFQKAIYKTGLVGSLKNKGITYVGKNDEFYIRGTGTVFVLYKMNAKDVEQKVDMSQELFQRLHISHGEDRKNYQFVVIDQEVRSDLFDTKSTILKFEGGFNVSEDLYADIGKETEDCLIKMSSPKKQSMRPDKRAHVKLECPNAGNDHCSGNPITWMCSKCKEIVEFGTETKVFHCNCGSSDPKQAEFRCNEKEHGIEYIKYPGDKLSSDLSKHKAMKEKNILILGETGVGKSTWINGFINYLYFSDMEEAINAEEFHVLIPSSFIFTQKGKEKKIVVGGTDQNETMETGKSATKDPRSYVFYRKEEIIRLIDTPGVGDSGGVEQDKKNFDNILSFLTKFEDIHAVCILLKPNNARLTVMFRFCIQELLAHLHQSAKNNIVFCFTNARATFYQPGDTLPALNKELKDRNVGIQATEDNYFCFDNEPFRFLACVKSGVEFSQGDINTYADSWNKSVEETERLFEYIGTLKPHRIKNTLNMNESRRIIVAMSKPLAEVAKTIQHNLQEGAEAKCQIDLVDKDMAEMQTKLRFSGYGIKRQELGYPRTVCTHPHCISHVQVGQTRVQNTVYGQICHHHCGLAGIPTETANDLRLAGCAAMSGSNCRHCTHHYTVHMHITYHTEIIREDFLSTEVQDLINQKTTVKAKKEAFKRAIDTKNGELMEEEKIIMKTSAKYGSFLKANALIPYNDAVGDYLDMSIEQEKNKSQDIRNDALLRTLEDMKDKYIMERKILDDAIGKNTGDNINSPEEVEKLQKQLFSLQHMGKTLKDLFEGISISQSAKSMSFLEKKAPFRQNRKLKHTNNPIISLFYRYLWWPSDTTHRDRGNQNRYGHAYDDRPVTYDPGYDATRYRGRDPYGYSHEQLQGTENTYRGYTDTRYRAPSYPDYDHRGRPTTGTSGNYQRTCSPQPKKKTYIKTRPNLM